MKQSPGTKPWLQARTLMLVFIRDAMIIDKIKKQRPGPSCSKRRLLNKLVSGQNVNCTGKYNITFTGSFAEKNMSSFCK